MRKLKKLNRIANVAQIAVAICCTLLSAVIYPGVMVVIPVGAALFYVAVSIAAIMGSRVSTWISYSVTLIVSLIFVAGVSKFVSSDFQYTEGKWAKRQLLTGQAVAMKSDGTVVNIDRADITAPPLHENELDFTPYAFLFIAVLASFTLILKIIVFSVTKSRDTRRY